MLSSAQAQQTTHAHILLFIKWIKWNATMTETTTEKKGSLVRVSVYARTLCCVFVSLNSAQNVRICWFHSIHHFCGIVNASLPKKRKVCLYVHFYCMVVGCVCVSVSEWASINAQFYFVYFFFDYYYYCSTWIDVNMKDFFGTFIVCVTYDAYSHIMRSIEAVAFR